MTTPLEFRFRFLIHVVIFFLGFYAPWNYGLHIDTIGTWQVIAWFSRHVWLSFSVATDAVLVAGIVLALAAAVVRTWAASYLGSSTVQSAAIHGDSVVAAGPYRYVRNPLYLGIILLALALGLLMPPSGAIFTVVLIVLFQLRLIVLEQRFLSDKLGEPYRVYLTKVPELVPALRPRVAASELRPQWGQAFLGEIFLWGVFVSFAVLGWRYNSLLITRGILVSLGISIIVRALMPRRQ